MKDFDREFKDFMKEEFLEVKASSQFKNKIYEKIEKENKNIFSKIWNYEIEIDIKVLVATILLAVLIPSTFVVIKVNEMRENESKAFINTEINKNRP